MLGRADRDRLQPLAVNVEGPDPPRRALGDHPAALEREPGLQHRAGGRRHRAAAHPAHPAAGDEVADLDLPDRLAGLGERQGSGEVAGHPVVAERGQQRGAGALGAGAPLVEDAADERRLAGRVDVGRTGLDRRFDRGRAPAPERADGADHHVAGLEQGADARRVADVRRGDVEVTAELRREAFERRPATAGQQRLRPRCDERRGGQPPGVAGGSEEDDSTWHPSDHSRRRRSRPGACYWKSRKSTSGFSRSTDRGLMILVSSE